MAQQRFEYPEELTRDMEKSRQIYRKEHKTRVYHNIEQRKNQPHTNTVNLWLCNPQLVLTYLYDKNYLDQNTNLPAEPRPEEQGQVRDESEKAGTPAQAPQAAALPSWVTKRQAEGRKGKTVDPEPVEALAGNISEADVAGTSLREGLLYMIQL